MQAAMGTITAVILAAFAAYAGAWYTGAVEGNFAVLLMLATVVTGVYWVMEKLVFLPRRRRAAQVLLEEHKVRKEALLKQGFTHIEGDVEGARQKLLAQPWWLDWTAGLFPVILAVFVLRSFLFEPFKIPSGSMIPTLRIGDLILVNKFHYGVRLPVFNTKLMANHEPQRGDVMVFRYPPQPSLDYIKRVIGVPGDVPEQAAHGEWSTGAPRGAARVLRWRDHALRAPVPRDPGRAQLQHAQRRRPPSLHPGHHGVSVQQGMPLLGRGRHL